MVCSKLKQDNPHERLVVSLYLSCIMEEHWNKAISPLSNKHHN